MCLEKISEVKIAKKDISVWKYANIDTTGFSDSNLHNKLFKATILNRKRKGKLILEGNRLYFCTNDDDLDGEMCTKPNGYKYSWVLDHNVKLSTIKVKKYNIFRSIEVKKFKTPYQNVSVELNKEYKSQLIISEGKGTFVALKVVHIGLHSLKYKKDLPKRGENFAIKCIIPKGSNYVTGIWNNREGYASDSIIYGDKYQIIK